MRKYQDLVQKVLLNGEHTSGRNGNTISTFSQHYEVDLCEGFPLLTTKDLSGSRWESLLAEFCWYLSGEEHIRSLQDETSIWDEWAGEDGHLDTAYGRFWRRYPIPDDDDQLPGEVWADSDCPWVNENENEMTFDQIAYVRDQIREDPNSRRHVVTAWHPSNAAVSKLPPCHYTFVMNVQSNQLNTHLTQRSGDIALGIPFNIAAYSLLTHVMANATGYEVGTFSHTIVDAHIYCGAGDRGEWYAENLPSLKRRIGNTIMNPGSDLGSVKDYLQTEIPPEPEGKAGRDHVPGLVEQLGREPRSRPEVTVPDVPIDELEPADITLEGYDPHDSISFAVSK
jgi:thymidylate synthase